jgi:hypothetical protein
VLLTTFAPFPLVVLGIKYPWSYVLGLVGLEGALLFMLGGLQPLFFFSQYSMVSLVMAGAIRRGYSISQTIAGSVLIPLGVGGVLLVLYSVMVQQHPQVLLMHALDQVLRALQEQVQTMEQAPEVSEEHLTALATALPQLFLAMFPALLAINHLFTNVCNYVLVRRYCQHSRAPRRLDPEDLTVWRASDYLVWVFLASGVALLLPFSPLSTIGLNVFPVTLAIYLLQGVAIAVFWGQRLPLPLGLRCLLAVVVLLVAGPLCAVLCTVAGLFDLWIDFRRQRRQGLIP